MKWTLSQLRKQPDNVLDINETVDVSELKQLDPQVIDVSPMQINGRAVIQPEKIVFDLTIQGMLTLPCARTLVEVPYPVHLQTRETFYLKANDEDEEGHLIVDERIDLLPIVLEELLLDIPMQIFADSEDSLAPQKGNGWEVVTESSQADKIDPRMAKLAELLDNRD